MASAGMRAFLHQLSRGMAAEALADCPDRQLVARLLERRDEAAFEALLRRHGPMVYRVCWRVLGRDQDAEDAFQATFLVLAQRLRAVRHHASLASWLHGVARRVALKARARAATRCRHEAQAPASRAASTDEAAWGEVRAALDEELARLPERWRLPLVLCYLEGHTQDEAAAQLGWTKITLRRRLDEAREALGRRLARRGLWPAALSAVLACDCAAAAVPPRLVLSTVNAATGVAAGQAMAAVGSAKVVALTQGVLKTMFLTRLEVATAVLILTVLASGGATLLAERAAASQADPAKVAKPGEERPRGKEGTNPGGTAAATREDYKKFQGSWRLVYGEYNGGTLPDDVLRATQFVFSGTDYQVKQDRGPGAPGFTLRFRIDATKSPRQIDVLGAEKPEPGIYTFVGDLLIMAYRSGGARPSDFTSKADSFVQLYVLKRHDPPARADEPMLAKSESGLVGTLKEVDAQRGTITFTVTTNAGISVDLSYPMVKAVTAVREGKPRQPIRLTDIKPGTKIHVYASRRQDGSVGPPVWEIGVPEAK